MFSSFWVCLSLITSCVFRADGNEVYHITEPFDVRVLQMARKVGGGGYYFWNGVREKYSLRLSVGGKNLDFADGFEPNSTFELQLSPENDKLAFRLPNEDWRVVYLAEHALFLSPTSMSVLKWEEVPSFIESAPSMVGTEQLKLSVMGLSYQKVNEELFASVWALEREERLQFLAKVVGKKAFVNDVWERHYQQLSPQEQNDVIMILKQRFLQEVNQHLFLRVVTILPDLTPELLSKIQQDVLHPEVIGSLHGNAAILGLHRLQEKSSVLASTVSCRLVEKILPARLEAAALMIMAMNNSDCAVATQLASDIPPCCHARDWSWTQFCEPAKARTIPQKLFATLVKQAHSVEPKLDESNDIRYEARLSYLYRMGRIPPHVTNAHQRMSYSFAQQGVDCRNVEQAEQLCRCAEEFEQTLLLQGCENSKQNRFWFAPGNCSVFFNDKNKRVDPVTAPYAMRWSSVGKTAALVSNLCGVAYDASVQCVDINHPTKKRDVHQGVQDPQQVSGSTYYACVLDTDRVVSCWYPSRATTQLETRLKNIDQVAVSGKLVCGYQKSTAMIECVDQNIEEQRWSTDIPSSDPVQLDFVGRRLCVTTVQQTKCWEFSPRGRRSKQSVSLVEWSQPFDKWSLFSQHICGYDESELLCKHYDGVAVLHTTTPFKLKDVWYVNDILYALSNKGVWVYRENSWHNLTEIQNNAASFLYLSRRDKKATILTKEGMFHTFVWQD